MNDGLSAADMKPRIALTGMLGIRRYICRSTYRWNSYAGFGATADEAYRAWQRCVAA
jgi:hypothetical protein